MQINIICSTDVCEKYNPCLVVDFMFIVRGIVLVLRLINVLNDEMISSYRASIQNNAPYSTEVWKHDPCSVVVEFMVLSE